MSSPAFDSFGCFGKLPISREFLVDRAPDLSASGLDTWISEGMAFARGPLGSRWKPLATGFPPYRYAWTGRDRKERFLYGELVPSEDAAGRIHPFTVFGVVDRSVAATGRATFPLELFALGDDVRRLREEAWRASGPDEAVRTVRGWRHLLSTEIGSSHDSFLQQPAREFWDRLAQERPNGGSASPSLCHQVMQALVETVTYLRGRKLPEIRMSIRYPILRGAGAEAEQSVAFWLELTARLLGTPLDGICCFWTQGATELSWPPMLLVSFSPPSTAQFSALIDPESNLETVSYLERPYGEPPETRMDASLRTLLDGPSTSLSDLLGWAAASR